MYYCVRRFHCTLKFENLKQNWSKPIQKTKLAKKFIKFSEILLDFIMRGNTLKYTNPDELQKSLSLELTSNNSGI